MTTFRLKHIKAYVDRHGRRRYYFRKPGAPTVALPGKPGTREFMDAYHAATEAAPREIGADRTKAGSFSALIVSYYRSAEYAIISEKTKKTYRYGIEKFRAKHGNMSVATMEARHVKAYLDGLGGRQENMRKVLRLLFSHAVMMGYRKTHPMATMRLPRKPAKGFIAWSEGDIAAYLDKWPTGTRERLALALLVYTGQRRSDVVTMGRQHIKDGRMIRVVQQKTGSELWIPLHADLKAEIEANPKEHLNLLTTQYGQPFTAAGFGNWFGERARSAGLVDRTAHGLRKAAARRLAEAGCTPSQIMAVTGHKNLSEVTLYTASADQVRLAEEAIARTEVSNPQETVRQNGQKMQ